MAEDRDVSKDKCMQKLVAFAAELPPELRKKLYETAIEFLDQGFDFGKVVGLSAFNPGGPAKTDRKPFLEYLRRMEETA